MPRGTYPRRDFRERFWEKVNKNGPIIRPELGPCWIWTGNTRGKGYGRISVRGEIIPVHRLSWEIAYGPIPEGSYALHHCDNPPCVRPDHLFLGTKKDNMYDCMAKGRNRFKSHPGEENWHDKLTLEQVLEIKEALKNYHYGMLSDLARKYGVHRNTIHSIKSGASWEHLSDP